MRQTTRIGCCFVCYWQRRCVRARVFVCARAYGCVRARAYVFLQAASMAHGAKDLKLKNTFLVDYFNETSFQMTTSLSTIKMGIGWSHIRRRKRIRWSHRRPRKTIRYYHRTLRKRIRLFQRRFRQRISGSHRRLQRRIGGSH